MLRTERIPVTLYTSEDANAPRLTHAAGSLKTLLKACLVTGYGAKPAAGWEAAFEENNKIALRCADPKSPQGLIRIDNTAAGYADVQVYTAMSGLDAGEAVFAQPQRLYVSDTSYKTRKWWLIACARGFAFFGEGRNGGCRYLYFGDFPTLAAGDNGNMVCIASAGSSGFGQNIYPAGFPSQSSGLNSTLALLKSYDGLTRGATAILHSAAAAAYNSSNYFADYPSPVSGGFSAFPVFIMENSNSRRATRGLLPGVSAIAERMAAVPVGTEFALDGGRYICLDFGDNLYRDTAVLIAADFWEI